MNDLGDKMTPEEKGRVNTKIDALKKAIESGNESNMKSAKDDLNKTMQEFGARLYQQAGGQGAPDFSNFAGNAGKSAGNNDNDTVDAEFSDKN